MKKSFIQIAWDLLLTALVLFALLGGKLVRADQYYQYPGPGVSAYPSSAFFPTYASDGTLAIAVNTYTLYTFESGSSTWTAIASAASPGVTTLGPVGSAPNANAGLITGTTLVLEPASGSFPGVVTTGAQTFAGAKTFSSTIVGNISGTAAAVNLATSGAGGVTGVLPVANGGTNASSLTGHGAVVMNSAGTAQTTVAPGTSGNVLTSNGTDWTSATNTSSLAIGNPVSGGGANQVLFEDGSQNLASSSLWTFFVNGGVFGASPDLILGSTSSTDNELHQLGAIGSGRLIFAHNLGTSGSGAYFSIDTNPSGDGKTHFKVQDASGNSGEMFSATLGASPNVTFPSAITASVSVTTPIVSNSSGVAVQAANNNTAASAGYVGELLGPISRLRSAATTLTTNTTVNVATTTSITLTAGHWLVSGVANFQPAGSTTISELDVGISATSATMPNTDAIAVPASGEVFIDQNYNAIVLGAGDYTMTIPAYVVNVANAATLPLYLVARATFGVSTLKVNGSMYATRLW